MFTKLKEMFSVLFNKPLTDEQKLIKLRKQGLTQKQIAQELGLTQNQVKGRLQKLLVSGQIERRR